jgi:hypothetical protein
MKHVNILMFWGKIVLNYNFNLEGKWSWGQISWDRNCNLSWDQIFDHEVKIVFVHEVKFVH